MLPRRYRDSQNCEGETGVARIVLKWVDESMKPSAQRHMNIHHTLSAVIAMMAATAVAQTPAAPEPPVTDGAAPSAPASFAPPVVTPPPANGGNPADPGAPVPIEPPIQNPAAGTVDPGTLPPGGLPPVDPNAPKASEFQGDEIGLVLRTLARQARMNVVVSPQVVGVVNMRIEDKTPREVVEIICQANGLIIDELNGVSYIKTAAEKAKEPTEAFKYTFSYAKAETAAPLLQSQLSSALAPQVDVRTNTIFYREGKSNADKIKEFLVSIDKPTQQVMIEARLVEVNANPKQSYGINWAGVVGGAATPQTVKYGGSSAIGNAGGALDQVVVDPLSGKQKLADFAMNGATNGGFGDMLAGQFAILSVPQLSATLRLLNEDSDAEFLAQPRIVTANNQKAEIKVTRNQPVPQLNFNEQTAQAVFGGFEDKEFGNTLVVTPSINKDNFVTLAVQPEISNKVGDATFTFGGATVASPIIDTRTFDSNVVIRSGDTLAIGGLLQDETTKARAKVPVFGDIPLFGYLFQERMNGRTKRNLLVFVTPTVIKQGYGTGLENQVSGLTDSREEFSDENGWRNNARGTIRIVPTSDRPMAAEYPVPGQSRSKRAASKYKVSSSAGR